MRVDADASARVFGNTVDAIFEDMDANGEHGLALTLIATALDELRGPDYDAAVTAILDRVEVLANQYVQRETPVQYV